MINRLPDDFDVRIPHLLEEYARMALSTAPADRKRAEEGVIETYQKAGLPPPGEIVWCRSPGEMLAIVRDRFPSEARPFPVALRFSQRRLLIRAAFELGQKIDRKLCEHLQGVIERPLLEKMNPVADLVANLLIQDTNREGRLGDPPETANRLLRGWRAETWKALKTIQPETADQLSLGWTGDQVDSACWRGQHDIGWLWFFSFAREVFGLAEDAGFVEGIVKVAESAGWWIPGTETCWISERHDAIRRDARGRLHVDGAPAVQYPDGWGAYAWHGVPIPSEWGRVRSEQWRPDWIFDEKNQTLRRVLIEGIGHDRLAHSQGQPIHVDGDMELLGVWHSGFDPIVFLKVKCPSTGLFYVLRVPPEMRTCRQARNWTLWNERDRMKFVKET
ncbi:MAG: hypothetical protein V1809_05795 [Planctomycetota bacterium]